MMMRRQVLQSLLVGLLIVLALGLGALAQSVSLTVMAYSDAVRFSAQGSVKELRVEVLSLSGQKVFDSGPVLSNALDWKLLNTRGQPVANGVYIYTVTVKDPSGNVTKKLGKLAVLRGKGVAAPPLSGITIGRVAQPQTEPCPGSCDYTHPTDPFTISVGTHVMRVFGNSLRTTDFQLTLQPTGVDPGFASVVFQNFRPDGGGTLLTARGSTAEYGGAFSAQFGVAWDPTKQVVMYHDGTNGEINVGGGDLRFTAGNFFTGSQQERMRLTSAGTLIINSSSGTNALEIYNTQSGTNLIFRVERATGNVYADGSFTGGGADVAERIDASEQLEPGDVVEIDPDNPGKFRKAREAISTRVAGVISTAPGVVLGNKDAVSSSDARPILALAGRVPVKATAKFGAIQVGDLLVSSPIPGYAMKCPEASKCIGAVIGKALEPLSEGTGLIEIQIVLR